MERKNLAIGITAVAVLGVGGAFLWMGSNDKTDAANTSVLESQVSNLVFKDGAYNAEGDYLSPGGREKVFVSLVIKDNIIESVVFEGRASDPTSKTYQKLFADNFKNKVVGKKISDVKLDKVSGSSLTSNGFNQALQKIKNQAKES
jgi:uncharacterized protein with FMN-binding domain